MKRIVISLVSLFILISSSIMMLKTIMHEQEATNYYNKIDYETMSEKINEEEVVVVYYYKLDCVACSLLKEDLNALILENNYVVYGIDIMEDEMVSREIVDEYRIEVTPTIITFINGEEFERLEGNEGKKKLEDFLVNSKVKE